MPGRPYDAPSAPAFETKPPTDRPFSDWTKDELYQRAQELDIPGRSKMTKKQLAKALGR